LNTADKVIDQLGNVVKDRDGARQRADVQAAGAAGAATPMHRNSANRPGNRGDEERSRRHLSNTGIDPSVGEDVRRWPPGATRRTRRIRTLRGNEDRRFSKVRRRRPMVEIREEIDLRRSAKSRNRCSIAF